jgi:hypothetical protein
MATTIQITHTLNEQATGTGEWQARPKDGSVQFGGKGGWEFVAPNGELVDDFYFWTTIWDLVQEVFGTQAPGDAGLDFFDEVTSPLYLSHDAVKKALEEG